MFNEQRIANRSYVQQAYPVRYWLFIAYCVGVPCFIRFDVTGRTHNLGLFNPWSLATMALTFGCAFLFVVLTTLERGKMIVRKVHFSSWMWLSLLLIFSISTILEPNFVVQAKPATDLYLSFYRLAEWVLGFVLFLSLYSREPLATSVDMAIGIVARICWIWIAIVWIVLPVAPSYAYSYSADDASSAITYSRLGGSLTSPGVLAICAGIACFHAITCLSGTKRVVLFSIAAVSLLLTYVRGEEIAITLSLIIYAMFFARGTARMFGMLAVILGATVVAAYWQAIILYMGRGNGVGNIATLTDRTNVWAAAFKAFWIRPYIGYGYVAGVKGALRDNWRFAYWVPPHAHNDWIQALVSGGILGGTLLVCIYGRAFYSAISIASEGPKYMFFFFALFQLAVGAFLGPLVTQSFGSLAAIFLVSFVVVNDHYVLRSSRPNGAGQLAGPLYTLRKRDVGSAR